MQKLAGEPPFIPPYADPPLLTPTPAPLPTATPTALPFDVPFAERKLVLWSKLVLVGPTDDPAKAGKEAKVTNALQDIANTNATIIATTQETGINQQTDRIWGLVGKLDIIQRGKGYRVITGNALDGLREAEKTGGYIILPLNVYINNRVEGKSKIIYEKDLTLFLGYEATIRNYISIPGQDITLPRKFVAYLLSPTAQNLIESYKNPLSATALFYSKDLSVFIPK
jgi:tungstate transport system substrate-binding protein